MAVHIRGRMPVNALFLMVLTLLASSYVSCSTELDSQIPHMSSDETHVDSFVEGTTWTRLLYAEPGIGTYNMSPMLGVFNGVITAFWKNAPQDEDQAGQRVLYSQSTDGVSWTPNDGTQEAFPNMSTSANNAHLFAEPMLTIRGRAYAAASPKQFCLYPDQYFDLLLLRQVLPGLHKFGPVFWASKTIPHGFEEASHLQGVVTVADMDAQTQSDIDMLSNPDFAPCNKTDTSKCEYCQGGCQDWQDTKVVPGLENERALYTIPNDNQSEVLLYRSYLNKKFPQHNYLYAAVRDHEGANWTLPTKTNITNDVSNLNAGNLPDGRAYLVNNWVTDVIIRNPLHLSIAGDGLDFKRVGQLANCEQHIFRSLRQPWGCLQRHKGGSKEGGPQYPQSIAITGSDAFAGYMYTVFSNNKEDIWMVRTPLSSL